MKKKKVEISFLAIVPENFYLPAFIGAIEGYFDIKVSGPVMFDRGIDLFKPIQKFHEKQANKNKNI
jgi:hypothetical protein